MELPGWYVGPFLGYALPDADRNVKSGLNLQLVAGKVFAESVAVEAVVFSNQFGADGAASADADLLGYGLDLALGTPDPGNPVFSLGAGAVQHDIGGVSKTETFGNLALGYYLPVTIGGELWRLEARYHAILTDHPSIPTEDVVEDVRLSLGVLFAFGRNPLPPARERPPEPEPVPTAPPPPPPAATPVAQDAPAFSDEDGDGVPDGGDRCPGTAAELKVDAKGCVVPTQVVIRSAYFGADSSSLTARGYELLHAVAGAMKADPAMRLEIEGHSDVSGPADKNMALSQYRADVVREVLVSLGIDSGRLVARGYGETRPINDNKTLEKRAANRRVQFRRLDR